jgi:uncharacterized protein
VISGICAHCAQSRFRFAVLDGPSEPANFLDLDPRAQWPTSRAAYYIPWLAVPDGAGSRLIPPSGHVLGIFVRTDTSRGIWKAPANEQVHGIAGLQAYLGNAQQEVLNPRGVNVIRKFEGRGIRVWGARTLSADPDFRYIPVGRFLAWIERSLARGTQWAIFEQQGEPLWAKVRTEVTLFLRDQWRAGALPGATEEKAFYVRCDRSTMTDADIQAGRLICEIGVALIRPAEFVVFRIMHQMAG